jgi:UDP-GlcNAc3NAcA epimerase
MILLEKHCSFICTDSGGVQKEAYFFQKPCITIRDQTEWTETVDAGWNVVTEADQDKILNASNSILQFSKSQNPKNRAPFMQKQQYNCDLFGDGSSAIKIVDNILGLLM